MIKKLKKYLQRKEVARQVRLQKYRNSKFKISLIARKEFDNALRNQEQ